MRRVTFRPFYESLDTWRPQMTAARGRPYTHSSRATRATWLHSFEGDGQKNQCACIGVFAKSGFVIFGLQVLGARPEPFSKFQCAKNRGDVLDNASEILPSQTAVMDLPRPPEHRPDGPDRLRCDKRQERETRTRAFQFTSHFTPRTDSTAASNNLFIQRRGGQKTHTY